MLKGLVLFLVTLPVLAQTTPGQVVVTTTVTAIAGSELETTINCTGTPTVSASVSSMRMVCTVGGQEVVNGTFTASALPGVGLAHSVHSGGNAVTWLLVKGMNTPDRWEVSANGVMKTGNF